MSDQSETVLRQAGLSGAETTAPLNLLSLSEKANPAKDSSKQNQQHYPQLTAFPGSYYHKVYSPYGSWTGIDAVVTLGQPHLDPKRSHNGVAQDTFSTYLGGRAKKEIDAGLGWEVTSDKNGKVDTSHKAWRPFWRNGQWHNAPSEQRYYWHPGETVAMSLHVVAPNKLQLTVSDLGDKPARKFTATFNAPGFGLDEHMFFKRVDAIDQNGTEGKHVHSSHSHIEGTTWRETILTKKSGAEQALVPGFGKVIDDPPAHVRVSSTHQQRLHGGESVEIKAAKK